MISELPKSREAERVLVGCPILSESPDLYLSVAESIDPDDFFFDSMRDVFLATGSVVKKGGGVNGPLVAAELAQKNVFASETLALGALGDICWGLPRLSDLQSEIRVVRDNSLSRRIVRLKSLTETEIIKGSSGPEALEFLEEGIAELRSKFRSGQSQLVESTDAVDSLLKELEHEWEHGRPQGRDTGLKELDRMLQGLQPGRLYTLAARTGMGKTWLALNLALAIIRAGRTVLFISLEMLPEEMTLRLISHISGIDSSLIRDKLLDSGDKKLLRAALKEVKGYSLTYGRPGMKMTPAMIRSHAKKTQAHKDLGLIVVDYLQLVKPDGKQENRSREREVAEVSSSLKNLSLELKVPVLALSQLNRAIDYQKDREPELSDLRESGAIEQDSDCVIFLHGKPEDDSASLFLKKNRGGPVGRIPINLYRSTGRMTYREEK